MPQIFKLEDVGTAAEHKAEPCAIPGLPGGVAEAKVAISGDVAFAGYPHVLSASFAANGQTYAGAAALMHDPIASPMRANVSELSGLPPIQVGSTRTMSPTLTLTARF